MRKLRLSRPAAVAVYACDRGGVTAGNSVLVTGAGLIGDVDAVRLRGRREPHDFSFRISMTSRLKFRPVHPAGRRHYQSEARKSG